MDDERAVLDGLARTLHERYDVTTATSGKIGLELQAAAFAVGRPFPVILTDMRMPGMDGVRFLAAARAADPEVVGVVLTGHADLDAVIAAMNEIGVFSVLVKPCARSLLIRALDAALAHNRLLLSERMLLHGTLQGLVDVLTELTAPLHRSVLIRSERIHRLVTATANLLNLEADWELHAAGRLSQVGCLAIPSTVLERACCGGYLTPEEDALYRAHPVVAKGVLGRIPRLERVADWIHTQALSAADVPPSGAPVPQLLLSAVTGFVCSMERTSDLNSVLESLGGAGYPARLLEALSRAAHAAAARVAVARQVGVQSLQPGMELREDVVSRSGIVLAYRGDHVTGALALQLRSLAEAVGIREPFTVMDSGIISAASALR